MKINFLFTYESSTYITLFIEILKLFGAFKFLENLNLKKNINISKFSSLRDAILESSCTV